MRLLSLLSVATIATSLVLFAEETLLKPLREIPEPEAMTVACLPFSMDGDIGAVAWSPDGKFLAGCASGGGQFVIWSAATGVGVRRWTAEGLLPQAIAWSPDGALVVAGGVAAAVAWEAGTAREVRRIEHEGSVVAVAFLPGTRKLLSASDGGEMKVTDLAGNSPTFTLPSPARRIRSIAVSADGRKLAVGGLDPQVAVVDLAGGEPTVNLRGDEGWPATWIGWSEGGDKLHVHPSRSLLLEINAATGLVTDSYDRTWLEEEIALGATPDGRDVAMFADTGMAGVRRRNESGLTWRLEFPPVEHPFIAVSPDGLLVALPYGARSVTIVSIPNGTVLAGGQKDGPRPRFVAWSADGKTVFATRGATEVHAFSASTGKRLRGYVAPGNLLLGLAPRDDGALVAATFSGGWLRVTDLTCGHDLVREALREIPAFLALSADGSTFAWSQEDAVRLMDLIGPGDLPSIRLVANPVDGVIALSPKGDVLMQIDRKSQEFVFADTTSGRIVRNVWLTEELNFNSGFSWDSSLTGFGCRYGVFGAGVSASYYVPRDRRVERVSTGIACSPDGRMVAHVSSGLQVLEIPAETVHSTAQTLSTGIALAWSPDSRRIATLHQDGSTKIWSIPSPVRAVVPRARDPILDWGDMACQRADRAHEAAEQLMARGADAVALVREKLAEREDQPHIRDLIAQLLDESFTKRKSAREELQWLGIQAEPELARALAGQPPGAWREELESLLREAECRVGPSSQNLRRQRAMKVLEGIGSAEAADVLRHLSSESPSPRERSDAQDALRRIEMRHSK